MKGFGTTSTSRTARLLPAIALATILASCTTTPTTASKNNFTPPPKPAPAQSNNASTGRFVPCSQDPIISFNAQPAPDDPKFVDETAANIFDTPETISAVRKHNAAAREACDK